MCVEVTALTIWTFLRHRVFVHGQCGFFKRKQREQLIRKKRESDRHFPEEDTDDVCGATGIDVIERDDVIDEGRGLTVKEDDVQEKRSVYDNDAEGLWWCAALTAGHAHWPIWSSHQLWIRRILLLWQRATVFFILLSISVSESLSFVICRLTFWRNSPLIAVANVTTHPSTANVPLHIFRYGTIIASAL